MILRNLPVFDGALYSDKENGLRAGIYFCHGKEKIVWDEITYQEDVPGKSAKITLKKQNEYTVLRLFEQKAELTSNIKDLTLVPVYAADNVYGKKGTRDGTFANGNGKASISYIQKAVVSDQRADFLFDGFRYGFALQAGRINSDGSLSPQNGTLTVTL